MDAPKDTLRVVLFLFLGLVQNADGGQELFNVASGKRPTVWPPDDVCHQSDRSEFCADFALSPSSEEITCTNKTRCEPACLTTFYYVDALDHPELIVDALDDSRSTGFSDCVAKDHDFRCGFDRIGNYSVRFQSIPSVANCSLIVESAWLAPILNASVWNMTVSMWVYSKMQETMVGTLVEMTSVSNLTGPILRIFLNSTNIVIHSGESMWTNVEWILPVYRWRHFAFTVFEDVVNIFVNGEHLSPGAYNLRLLPHNEIDNFRLGQSTSGDSQFTGYLQNVQIFFGALSNREIAYLYNSLSDEGFLVEPSCTCPSKYPALVDDNSLECRQNPGSPDPHVRVPRLNHLAHPLDYVTDGNPDTFWVSGTAATTSETNSIAIDFERIYRVLSVDLSFLSPFPLATEISRKRAPTLPWEPWLSFRRNCSEVLQSIPCISLNGSLLSSGHLIFNLNEEVSPGSHGGSDISLASAVNISMVGFPIERELFRYHALYEVVINATCYCYGNNSSCDHQSCICDLESKTMGTYCEKCFDEYYLNSSADDHVCRKCTCDWRGIISNDCNQKSGKCWCKANVRGYSCDTCAKGYYNLTLSNPVGCDPCQCQTNNTVSCDSDTGRCVCEGNVEGSTCDRCRAQTFWSKTGQGCEDCGCYPGGTLNRSLDCNVDTGQCECRDNVIGRNCSHCRLGFYGLFGDELGEGCKACNCSPMGAVEGTPCDEVTGQCNCRPGEGIVALGGQGCNSYVSQFYPTFGPESGGTAVNISVGFVGNLANISVHIGPVPCGIDSRTSSAVLITCVTSSIRNSSELLNKSLPLTIRLPDGQTLVAQNTFVYELDPLIEKVWPLRTIESGGINLTVIGSSLSSVAMPRLRIMMTQFLNDGTQNVTLFQSPCYHIANNLICPTPRLTLPKDNSSRKRRDDRRTVRGLDADTYNKSNSLRFYIGFLFDGVTKYLNLSETLPQYGLLDVYSNPTIYDFTEPNHVKEFYSSSTDNDSYISIQGRDLNLGANIFDYVVQVGLETCSVATLTSNQLTCIPPGSQPKPENEYFTYDGLPAVKVTVGNIQVIPGYLEYVAKRTPMDDPVVRYSVIGVVIAVVVLVVVVVSYVVVSKHKQTPKHFDRLSIVTEDSGLSSNFYSQAKNTLRPRSIYLAPVNSAIEAFLCRLSDELRLKVEDCLLEGQDLSLVRILGEGNFGQVFVGELTGNDNAPLQVAVKTIKDDRLESNPHDVVCFLEEATLMYHLHHEHVLGLIGIVLKPSSTFGVYVVLPFMENGDLRSFILSENNVLTVKALIEFGLQVVDGMKYLELNKFVHRDLACRNCMVSDRLVVKVADFGLSRDIYEKDYYRASGSKCALPVKWMAIESLETGVFTTKSDVWSFGVLLWELITRGCSPYPDVDHLNIRAHLKAGKRLGRPEYAPDEIYSIMSKCWQEDPDMRPTFETIEHDISNFLKHSVKQKEDSYKQETESDVYSKPSDEAIDYVRLSNYGNEQDLEMKRNFPCSVDIHQDINTNNGSTIDHQTVPDVGHLLEINTSTGATLSNAASFSLKDSSHLSGCIVNSDACYNNNMPSDNVRNYTVDDVTSEYTHL